jgi:hypothetical protein
MLLNLSPGWTGFSVSHRENGSSQHSSQPAQSDQRIEAALLFPGRVCGAGSFCALAAEGAPVVSMQVRMQSKELT